MPVLSRLVNIIRDNLRIKVTIGIILPLVIVLGILTSIEQSRHRQAILENLSQLASQSGRVIESSLRHSMLNSDFPEMQNILDSINEKNKFRVIYLLNSGGKIIFAPQKIGVGSQLDNQKPDCQPCHSLETNTRPSSIVVTADDGQDVFRSMYPITNSPECSTCHDPDQRLIGLLLIDIPVASVENLVVTHLRENLLWWAGAILATILIVNLVMNRMVITRLQGLAHGMSGFRQDRQNMRLETGDMDEIGQLAKSFNEMSTRIEEDAEYNRSLSEELRHQSIQRGELLKKLITAQEDERKRIAREIHDDLGQMLSALIFQTEILERLISTNPEAATQQLDQIQDLITEALNQMYELILALRPAMLDELGLITAILAHAERFFQGSGIEFGLISNGFSNRLDPDQEIAIYRIVQEALNNVRRHSGASKVEIRMQVEHGILTAEIEDNGRGFDPQVVKTHQGNAGGIGLLSMQERVAQFSGDFKVISGQGDGTLIRFSLPIEGNYA